MKSFKSDKDFIESKFPLYSEKDPSFEVELEKFLLSFYPKYDTKKDSVRVKKLISSTWENPLAKKGIFMSREEIDKAFASIKDEKLYDYCTSFSKALNMQLSLYKTLVANPSDSDGVIKDVMVAIAAFKVVSTIEKYSIIAKIATGTICAGTIAVGAEAAIIFAISKAISYIIKNVSESINRDEIENSKNILGVFETRTEDELSIFVDSLSLKVTELKKSSILRSEISSKDTQKLVEAKIKETSLKGDGGSISSHLAIYDVTALLAYISQHHKDMKTSTGTLIDNISKLVVTGEINSAIDSSFKVIAKAVFSIEYDNPLLNDPKILQSLSLTLDTKIDDLIERSSKLLENGLFPEINDLVKSNDIESLSLLLGGDLNLKELEI
jgi:hypothetical protein